MKTSAFKLKQTKIVLALILGSLSCMPLAYALPTGGSSTTATIGTSGTTMNITGATNNVINWQTYNIANGETVAYDANNYLNLVKNNEMSKIYGNITGGGTIYLINPNGVLFGSSASVNVGNLVVSTRPLSQVAADAFAKNGTNPLATTATLATGEIMNLGTLKANSITMEGSNITLKNVANQQTPQGATLSPANLTLKSDGNVMIGYQVNNKTTITETNSSGVATGHQVSNYATATTAANLTADHAPTTLGYTATKLDGTTANTVKNAMYVSDVYELQNVNSNLSGTYMQLNDIDASETNYWNAGQGFLPIATGSSFTGIYNGTDNTIQSLLINRPNTSYVGLFRGNSGTIEHIHLDSNSSIKGYSHVGSIIGHMYAGSLRYAINDGTVYGNKPGGEGETGGLVGFMQLGTITHVQNHGDVTSMGNCTGGIVGHYVSGTTDDAYNSGNITSYGDSTAGIIGYLINSNAIVKNSYNTGTITNKSTSSAYAGGIVAESAYGQVLNCYNTGSISSTGPYAGAGGVVGVVRYAASNIQDCYNTGDVSSVSKTYYTGGVVGYLASGKVIRTYNTGNVTGNIKGGIVGFKGSTANIADSAIYAITDSNGNAINQNMSNTIGNAATLADMKKTATYTAHGWVVDETTGSTGGIDEVGGKASTWRAYENDTTPLLKYWLTTTTAKYVHPTKVYDGNDTINTATDVTYTDTLDVDPNYVYVTGTQQAKNVGTYSNMLYSDQQHYDIINDVLTITPAPLVLSSDGVQMKQGQAFPDFTGSTTGLVAGETIDTAFGGKTLTFKPTVEDSQTIGVYGIIGYIGDNSTGILGNYEIFQAAPNYTDLVIVDGIPHDVPDNTGDVVNSKKNPVLPEQYYGTIATAHLTLDADNARKRNAPVLYTIFEGGTTLPNQTITVGGQGTHFISDWRTGIKKGNLMDVLYKSRR